MHICILCFLGILTYGADQDQESLNAFSHLLLANLKAGVGYIRQNNLQVHPFFHFTQAVNIYRSVSLI